MYFMFCCTKLLIMKELFNIKKNVMPAMLKKIIIYILLVTINIGLFSGALFGQKITFSANNISLEEVFNSIKKQTGYVFFYNLSTLRQTKLFDINVKNATINEVMDICLKNQHLNYTIKDKTIVIGNTNEPTNLIEKKNVPKEETFVLEITGTVKDSLGNPMEGVTIKVKKSTQSTFSKKDGHFSIKVEDKNAVLVFSFIGCETVERSVEGGFMDIVLFQISKKLDELVVIGYGSVRKKDVTGSVSKVDMNDLQKAPVRSFDEALAGRVAGVQVSSADGQPGAAVNIVIRGNNSITQDNSPLYVIDGFPIENPNNNVIDPSEIESMEVLKDASATAIYGSRGANGVIIITTKKGKIGFPVIAFETYYGNQKNLKEIPLMGAYDFVKYQWDLDSNNAKSIYLKNGKTVDSYKNVAAINWQDMMFRVGSQTNAHLAITGGTEKTKYSISASSFNQNGIIWNSDYKRNQGRLVLDQTINDKFKVGVNVNYSNLVQDGVPPTDNSNSVPALMGSVWGYRPVTGDSTTDLINQLNDPTVDPTTNYITNPIITVKNQVKVNTTNALTVNSYADYIIAPGLRLRATLGFSGSVLRTDVFNNSNTRSGSSTGTNGVNGSITYDEHNTWVNENTLTFNKKLNDRSTLNLVGGCTEQGDITDNYGFSARQIPLSSQSLGLGSLSTGTPYSISSTPPQNWTLLSFLSRANYSLDSKYLFTASFRADGSSKFTPKNRWGYFPSGAFAWRFGNEQFAKQLHWLSDAKLRTSFGVTGNNRVGDFVYSNSMSEPISAYYAFNNGISDGAVPTNLGNANLKWETTTQADIGLDVSLFENRIDITMDYYKKNTTNLLLNAKLRPSSGYATDYKNIGAVQNDGFEFSFNTINFQTKSFLWSTSFNISFNRSKVMALADNQNSLTSFVNSGSNPLYIARVGQPIAQFIGYVWDGVYQYNDFNQIGKKYVLKSTVPGIPSRTIQPGDIKYRDIDGDGALTSNDITVIGHPYPKHVGGITNNLKYKNFDLSIFFQWSYGNDIANLNRVAYDGNQNVTRNLNQFASYINRWSPTNQNTNIYRAGGGGPFGFYSSRIIEDGSYIRLKTVSIGYNFLPVKLKRMGIRTFRIYASGQNLITWTRYSGYDPEVSVYPGALTPGSDNSPYPRARTLIVGANLTF